MKETNRFFLQKDEVDQIMVMLKIWTPSDRKSKKTGVIKGGGVVYWICHE